MVGVAAILAVVVGVVVWRTQGADTKAQVPGVTSASSAIASPPTSPAVTPSAVPSSTAGIAIAPVVVPPSGAAPNSSLPGSPTSSTHAAGTASAATAGTASSAAEKAGRALVTFLGEPGTRVAVDGVARGACPVRVSLEPGSHDARFSFDPTSESLSEGFRVKAGEKMTVRAEFTGARPTVRIQR